MWRDWRAKRRLTLALLLPNTENMFSFLKNPKIILTITLLIVIPFISYNLITSSKQNQVLSEKAAIDQSPLISQSPSTSNLQTTNYPLPTTSPSPSTKPSKSTYTIAIIGDSMVDTMGQNLDYLRASLAALYPQTNFRLYNYGIGGQNVAQGLERLTKPFSYQTRNYPPIGEIGADIIIVASFAYNPFSPHNRDQHWLTLTQLVAAAKQTGAATYMLSEIAPLSTGFGDGPGGINWPPDLANQQAENIRQQLENAVSLSRSLGIPLINAYGKSTIDGKFGDRIFVSAHDGIHPSVEGHLLMADLIAQTIVPK